MRVTPDTGILVRMNVKATGPARRLLEVILAGSHELILSDFLLNELARVFTYPRIQRLYQLTADDIAEHVQLLLARADLVSPVVLKEVVLKTRMMIRLFIRPWPGEPMCCAPWIEISTRLRWSRFVEIAASG